MFLISLTSQITQQIRKLYSEENKRVVLKFKDEFAGDYIKEFICLKGTLYRKGTFFPLKYSFSVVPLSNIPYLFNSAQILVCHVSDEK